MFYVPDIKLGDFTCTISYEKTIKQHKGIRKSYSYVCIEKSVVYIGFGTI